MNDWRDRLHNFWIDQGVVRLLWKNTAEIAPGVFRANQPDRKRLEEWQNNGLRAVLYLRGAAMGAPYRAEAQACAALGLSFQIFHMSAHRLPPAERILALIALFREIEKPFVMHCRAGADRTGLASAIYLLAVAERPVSEARAMLAARFGHWRWSSTGVLDQMVLHYAAAHQDTGIGFEDWIRTAYDPEAITLSFKRQNLLARIRTRD